VLELPVNLHQLAKDRQCSYSKKAHKTLARKWHPDKAKGNKERAARKMNEVSEAKEKLVQELGC
jgi:DnaJ-class molecular chaperone